MQFLQLSLRYVENCHVALQQLLVLNRRQTLYLSGNVTIFCAVFWSTEHLPFLALEQVLIAGNLHVKSFQKIPSFNYKLNIAVANQFLAWHAWDIESRPRLKKSFSQREKLVVPPICFPFESLLVNSTGHVYNILVLKQRGLAYTEVFSGIHDAVLRNPEFFYQIIVDLLRFNIKLSFVLVDRSFYMGVVLLLRFLQLVLIAVV